MIRSWLLSICLTLYPIQCGPFPAFSPPPSHPSSFLWTTSTSPTGLPALTPVPLPSVVRMQLFKARIRSHHMFCQVPSALTLKGHVTSEFSGLSLKVSPFLFYLIAHFLLLICWLSSYLSASLYTLWPPPGREQACLFTSGYPEPSMLIGMDQVPNKCVLDEWQRRTWIGCWW